MILGHDEMQQHAALAISSQEQLILSDDESDEEEEACGGKDEEVYDDGEKIEKMLLKFRTDEHVKILKSTFFIVCRFDSTNARNLYE